MTEPKPRRRAFDAATIFIAIVLALAAIWLARPLLIPVALAVLFAFVLSPLVGLVERGVGRLAAVIGVVLVATLGLGALAWVGVSELGRVAEDLPRYRAQLKQRLSELRSATTTPAVEELEATVTDVLNESPQGNNPVIVVQPTPPAPRLTLATVARLAGNAGVVALLVVFILLERQELRNRVVHLVGERRLPATTRALDEASRLISRYLLTQAALNAAVGVIGGFALLLIGLPYPLLWGAAIALLRFVPFVGTWAGIALPTVFSLATTSGWTQPLMIAGVLALVVAVVAFGIEPFLHGRNAGASRLALFASIAFWAWLWGPVGLLIATPITVCLLVLGRHVPELKPLAVLLGSAAALPAPLHLYQRLLAGDRDEAAAVVEDAARSRSGVELLDDVVTPALVAARTDRLDGAIDIEDEARVIQGADRVLRAIDWPEPERVPAPLPLVLGCPADDDLDRVTLSMFEPTLGGRCRFEVLSPALLSAEVIGAVTVRAPVAVVIAAVPPGGLSSARYLVKRLRRERPGLKILVGRWGGPAYLEPAKDALLAAGATEVGTSMSETLGQLQPLLQLSPVAV